MEQEVIHQYYKKQSDAQLILIQVDPDNKKGVQLEIVSGTKPKKTKVYYQDEPEKELLQQGFSRSQAMEFHLYLKGLAK